MNAPRFDSPHANRIDPDRPGSLKKLAEADLNRRCAAIRAIILDVDGVLTDGSIWIDCQGQEIKRFHVRDGSAIVWWRRAGRAVAILSGRASPAVDHRAAELGIAPVVQGSRDKFTDLKAILESWLSNNLVVPLEHVAFVGDDLADLGAMQQVGLAICPSDAAPQVRAEADWVTEACGGQGAVREVIDHLLLIQELPPWKDDREESGRPRSTRPGSSGHP